MQNKNLEIIFKIRLYDLESLWADVSEKQRIAIIKSVIYTSPNAQVFHGKVIKELYSDKFMETLD